MLAIGLRVLPRFTHSCLREYSQVSTVDVGIGFALARIVPTPEAPRVGMSLACVSNKCANFGGLPCWHEFCISKIRANFAPRVAQVLTRGEGVVLC